MWRSGFGRIRQVVRVVEYLTRFLGVCEVRFTFGLVSDGFCSSGRDAVNGIMNALVCSF